MYPSSCWPHCGGLRDRLNVHVLLVSRMVMLLAQYSIPCLFPMFRPPLCVGVLWLMPAWVLGLA